MIENSVNIVESFWIPATYCALITGISLLIISLSVIIAGYKKDQYLSCELDTHSPWQNTFLAELNNFLHRLNGFWLWLRMLFITKAEYTVCIRKFTDVPELPANLKETSQISPAKALATNLMVVFPRKNGISWMFKSKKNLQRMKFLCDIANADHLIGVAVWETNAHHIDMIDTATDETNIIEQTMYIVTMHDMDTYASNASQMTGSSKINLQKRYEIHNVLSAMLPLFKTSCILTLLGTIGLCIFS